LPFAFANARICFPIANSFSLRNDCGALRDTDLIGDFPASSTTAITFRALFLATQVFVQVATTAFVGIDVMVDPFGADLRIRVPLEPSWKSVQGSNPGAVFLPPKPRFQKCRVG
jgi:hypothetical protein